MMEPALAILHRSLEGETEARTFLETTFSSFALDTSDVTNPKTYGGWNFINQAMNEIERYEALSHRHMMNNTGCQGTSLEGHARLLATMALGLARRSPNADHLLIDKCVQESAGFQVSGEMATWLKNVNFELREIVMGRLAATAFDFSFQRKSAVGPPSAFADRVVVETFCGILSANAVSNGPQAVHHFSTEWIVSTSKNLPPLALASLVHHLADEGRKLYAPAGTKEALQRLSVLVMSRTTIPILVESVSGDESSTDEMSKADYDHVVATCLRSIDAWLATTDLSLPQIRHICQKVNIDFVSVLSDAMYSDSHDTIDALAQLLETHLRVPTEEDVFFGRMKQLRFILELNEESFLSRFNAALLKVIEAKEIASMVEELISASGLQRFRFIERQNSGDHDVCRNLARIAASVTKTWFESSLDSGSQLDGGVEALLLKAAAHPSVNICGIALPPLARYIKTAPRLAKDLLRTLQRRAIISYHQKADGTVSLAASDVCGVHIEEFLSFRESVLSEALLSCWQADGDGYMHSCTAAIEEFCSSQARTEVSLGLEAALFCVEVVASDSLDSNSPYAYTAHLKKCFNALSFKPLPLTVSPLALARTCCLVGKYSRWFKEIGSIGGAADLVLSIFNLSAAAIVACKPDTEDDQLRTVSPHAEAALALKEILGRSNIDLMSEGAILQPLLNAWTLSYAVLSHGSSFSFAARQALATGICHVLANLPDETQRGQSLQTLAGPTIDKLKLLLAHELVSPATGDRAGSGALKSLADEVGVLSSLFKEHSLACSVTGQDMESGCSTSSKERPQMTVSVLQLIQQTWSTIEAIAKKCGDHEVVATSVTGYLSGLLPSALHLDENSELLKGTFEVARKLSGGTDGTRKAPASSLCPFLDEVVHLYGVLFEDSTHSRSGILEFIQSSFRDLLVQIIDSCKFDLGDSWMNIQAQGQGQVADECQSPPRLAVENVSNDQLEPILLLLRSTLEVCPSFILKVPSGSATASGVQALLLSRLMEAAVASLSDHDSSLVSAAIQFIASMPRLCESNNTEVRDFAKSMITHHRPTILQVVLKGCCTQYGTGILDDAAHLIYSMLGLGDVRETERIVVSAFEQEYFLLGDPSRNLAVGFMGVCTTKLVTVAMLRSFLEQVGQIQGAKDAESLPTSDVVQLFLERYKPILHAAA